VDNRGNVPLKVGPSAIRIVMYLIHPVTFIAYCIIGCTTYACHTVACNQ